MNKKETRGRKPKTKGKPRTKNLNLRTTEDEHAFLMKSAEENGESVVDFILKSAGFKK